MVSRNEAVLKARNEAIKASTFLFLKEANLCLDCDIIHNGLTCPSCSSVAVYPIISFIHSMAGEHLRVEELLKERRDEAIPIRISNNESVESMPSSSCELGTGV